MILGTYMKNDNWWLGDTGNKSQVSQKKLPGWDGGGLKNELTVMRPCDAIIRQCGSQYWSACLHSAVWAQ